MNMGQLAAFLNRKGASALGVCAGLVALIYVAACVLPGEPSSAGRIQFTLDFPVPYRVPLAGAIEPLITISADGKAMTNPSYRLESLDPSIVRVDSTVRRLLGVARGTAAVRVTYLGATGTPDTVFSARVVVSRVAVDSPTVTFTRLGARARLSAIAFDAADAAVPGVAFSWSSANPTVATVNDTGLVSAVGEGTVAITAEADSVRGVASVTVTQVAAHVRLAPELDTLRTVGRSIQLLAVAFDSSGNVLLTARPRWTSSDSGVTRVDSTGRATATGAGTARIIARVGEAADTATLVVAQVIRLIVVTPGYDTLTAIADTGRLVALAFDSLNFSISNPSVGWTTSDASIATVDQAGLVRAESNGVVLVTASAAGQGASSPVLVRQEVAMVRLAEDSVALTGKGDTVRLDAAGLDKNGHLVDAAVFGWRSSSAIVASVDSSGLVTAQHGGRTSIISTSGAARPDTATVAVTGALPADAIAFVSNRDGTSRIYIMNPDGSGVTPLTSGESPAWSPDGNRIAFSGIHVMNADGSGITKLTEGGADPTWSPDGTKIAFSGTSGIYVVNADGSGITKLTDGLYDGRPAWSPDGGKIAFERRPDQGEDALGQVYVMNADGSNVHRLTSPTASDQYAEGGPAWSPDGSRIAFWSFGWGVATINSDGSGSPETAYADPPYYSANYHSMPDWSPDGQMLIFGRFGQQRDLWLVGTDGSGLTQITTGGGWDAAWMRPIRE